MRARAREGERERLRERETENQFHSATDDVYCGARRTYPGGSRDDHRTTADRSGAYLSRRSTPRSGSSGVDILRPCARDDRRSPPV